MSAIEPLYRLFGIEHEVAKDRKQILEADFIIQLYKGLNENFRSHYKNYFRLMKFNREMEDAMLETNFMQNIIKDVVSTGEYTLEGIALYTNIPEEVIREIAEGINENPSFQLSRRIIELHRTVRLDLYKEIVKNVVSSYLEND